jgi:hypothetical protein
MAKKTINIRAGFDLKAFSTSSQNLQRQLRSSGKKMQSIGKSMSMSLTAPIAILGGLAVKTFANFEQSMAKVQAISGAVGKDFQNLTNLAKDLGIATRFSASEVSELMLNYSKLGFSSEEIQKITAATLDLALATGEDLAQSASVAGGTLRGFGLEAGEMTRVTDVMARAFSGSALDLQKFQNSMPKVSAVASSLGITLEETTSMLGVLVGKNIQATTAGTGLKNIFLKTRKSGISFKDAMDKIKNSVDPANTAMNMFGVENAQVAVALSQSGDAITEMNAKLSDTSVTASSMAAIMDATLEGSMMRLKSATEGLAISFGEIMAPAVGFVADILAKIAMKFANLNPYVKTAITVFAGLVAVLGPLAFAIGGIKLALATLMANPIILWVVGISAAIAGLVAVFMYVKDNAQFFADFFYNLWVKIANNTLDAVKTIAKGLAKFAGLFGVDIGVDAFFDKFKLKPREATKELKSFKETLKGIKNEITGLDEASKDSVLDVTPATSGTTTGGVKTGGRKFSKLLRIPMEAPPKKGIENVTKQISEQANKAIEPVKIKIEPLSNQELGIVTQAQRIGMKMGESLSSGLKSLATEGLVSFGNFLGSVISGGDVTMKDFGRGLLDSIGKFMGQFGEAMIAMGIAEILLKESIKNMNGPLAIVGGIALVAAGAAISNLSKKGIDTGGGGNASIPSMAGGGGMGAMNTQPIALETKISGRDLILVQNREKGFTR